MNFPGLFFHSASLLYITTFLEEVCLEICLGPTMIAIIPIHTLHIPMGMCIAFIMFILHKYHVYHVGKEVGGELAI